MITELSNGKQVCNYTISFGLWVNLKRSIIKITKQQQQKETNKQTKTQGKALQHQKNYDFLDMIPKAQATKTKTNGAV